MSVLVTKPLLALSTVKQYKIWPRKGANPMAPSKASLAFLGTWKLVKCECSQPNLPHPISGITTFTEEEDAIHYSNDGAWSNGRTVKVSADLQLDGNWHPVTGSALADSLSFLSLEDGSFEAKMKRGGVDTGISRSTVSEDGRTLTGLWDIIGPDTWITTSERQ